MNKKLTRRQAVKTIGLGTMGLVAASAVRCQTKPTHIITLSYDDGFEKSSIKTAEIYEKYGLSACINVIATRHKMQGELPDEYHAWPVGDFALWNELQRRGHEIMPHSFRHANLNEVSLEEAKIILFKLLCLINSSTLKLMSILSKANAGSLTNS